MNLLAKTLISIGCGCVVACAQGTADLDLAHQLGDRETQPAAVNEIVTSGRDRVPLLLAWTKAAPPQLNDLEVTILNDAIADIFGQLKVEEAIPYLVKNIGYQRFPPYPGVIWYKPLPVIEEQLPAMTALIRIGPKAAEAIMRASPWDMGTEGRQRPSFAVSEIAYTMKDHEKEKSFLKGMLALAESECRFAKEGLKRLE